MFTKELLYSKEYRFNIYKIIEGVQGNKKYIFEGLSSYLTRDNKIYLLASLEEVYFILWLEELLEKNIILYWDYESQKFNLNEKLNYNVNESKRKHNKFVEKRLHQYKYTPDFKIIVNSTFNRLNHNLCTRNNTIVCREFLIDTKGKSGARKSSTNSSSITFGLKQAWLFEKLNIFVNKVVPEDLFKKTFVPKLLAYDNRTKSITRNSKYIKCKLIEEII